MSSRKDTIVVSFVFVAIVSVNILPIEIGDFWWHMANGKWIIENGALPKTDVFSYTTQVLGSDNNQVLSGYWAAQVLMYQAWQTLGPTGMIILRTLFYSLLFALPYLALKRHGLSVWAALSLVIIPVPAMTSYIELRPKLLSYMMALIVFLMLDRRLEANSPPPGRLFIIGLPLLMALWANMHGAFVIGVGLILIFLCIVIWKTIVQRTLKGRNATLALTAIASIAACGINPTGLSALSPERLYGLVNKGGVTGMQAISMVHEFLPPLDYYAFTGDRRYFISLVVVSALSVIIFALNYRGVRPFHFIVSISLFGASLISYRYAAYLFVMFPLLAGYNITSSPLNKYFTLSPPRGAILVPAFSAILMLALLIPDSLRSFKASPMPEKAVEFIKQERPEPHLIAPYLWGGYLIWELYPQYGTFVDGRAMSAKAIQEHQKIMQAAEDTEIRLSAYGVNTILLHSIEPYSYNITPLMFHLLSSRLWEPSYWDTQSVIFTRKGTAHAKVKSSAIWILLESLAQARINATPDLPGPYVLMGTIQMKKGLYSYARESISRAIALDPTNPEALKALREINSKR